MNGAAWFEGSQGLTRYLQEVRKYPILSAEEELMLARRWRDQQDAAAAHQLVGSHLRLVAKIANGHRGYGLPLGELMGEGTIGMMQALNRYDPDRGFRLATYATWWIRAAIQDYILRTLSAVRMGTTAAQKKLFFNLRRLKREMATTGEGDLTPEQVATVAEALDVPEHDVVVMNRRLSAPDQSLNAPVRSGSESEWQDWLTDEADSPETVLAENEELSGRRELLASALEQLNERERHILCERRLKDNPSTLEQLSEHYGVSRERVRQIEERAFTKLQMAMKGQSGRRRRPQPELPHNATPRSNRGSDGRGLPARALGADA